MSRRGKRRVIVGQIGDDFIYYKDGGKRPYRRKKSNLQLRKERKILRHNKKLLEFRKKIVREYIRHSLFGDSSPEVRNWENRMRKRIRELRKQGEIIDVPLITRLRADNWP